MKFAMKASHLQGVLSGVLSRPKHRYDGRHIDAALLYFSHTLSIVARMTSERQQPVSSETVLGTTSGVLVLC
jgi:hypothetical protein